MSLTISDYNFLSTKQDVLFDTVVRFKINCKDAHKILVWVIGAPHKDNASKSMVEIFNSIPENNRRFNIRIFQQDIEDDDWCGVQDHTLE
jgi:hypothetical protein